MEGGRKSSSDPLGVSGGAVAFAYASPSIDKDGSDDRENVGQSCDRETILE